MNRYVGQKLKNEVQFQDQSSDVIFVFQNFLDNFPSNDVLVFVARVCLLFQMVTVYPMLGYLVRVQVMGQLFGNHYPR